MNYYYDILLNFEDEYCMFYEWDNYDNIEFIKKIPLFHIDNKVFKELLTNKIKVSNKFLDNILNKTKIKQNKSIKYACIFGDGKNAIALEFNNEGLLICKSSILLEDELNINEFMYSINQINIDYKIVECDRIRKETRQEEKIKKILKMEINNMYNSSNKSKLKYIYLEWFNELSDDYNKMYNNMINKLNNKLTKKEYKIYNLLKLTLSA